MPSDLALRIANRLDDCLGLLGFTRDRTVESIDAEIAPLLAENERLKAMLLDTVPKLSIDQAEADNYALRQKVAKSNTGLLLACEKLVAELSKTNALIDEQLRIERRVVDLESLHVYIDELEQQVQALRTDAKRYRFIRSDMSLPFSTSTRDISYRWKVRGIDGTHASFDDAIDSAMEDK